MRIAFTSTDGTQVDEHFGRVTHFYVWEVGPDRAEFAERVSAITTAQDEEDRTTARANRLFEFSGYGRQRRTEVGHGERSRAAGAPAA